MDAHTAFVWKEPNTVPALVQPSRSRFLTLPTTRSCRPSSTESLAGCTSSTSRCFEPEREWRVKVRARFEAMSYGIRGPDPPIADGSWTGIPPSRTLAGIRHRSVELGLTTLLGHPGFAVGMALAAPFCDIRDHTVERRGRVVKRPSSG